MSRQTDQDNSRASAIRLTDIPVRFTDDSFLRAKTGKMRDSHKAGYRDLSRAAEHIARPKALFLPTPLHIHEAGTPSVEIFGHIVQSPVVHANLRGLNRVFVFVITCGQELREWKESLTSPLDRFFADLICEHALQTAYDHLATYVTAHFHTHNLACMNPGSTPGWRLEDQRVLFTILRDAHEQIGVQLLDSFFMVPTHSTSGILFESEKGYSNCELCPLENCPNRRAAYDQMMRAAYIHSG